MRALLALRAIARGGWSRTRKIALRARAECAALLSAEDEGFEMSSPKILDFRRNKGMIPTKLVRRVWRKIHSPGPVWSYPDHRAGFSLGKTLAKQPNFGAHRAPRYGIAFSEWRSERDSNSRYGFSFEVCSVPAPPTREHLCERQLGWRLARRGFTMLLE